MDRRIVARITAEFFRQVSIMLAEDGGATIEGFGAFRTTMTHANRIRKLTRGTFKKSERGETAPFLVKRYITVHFAKAQALKKRLDDAYLEDGMDKYGVDETTGTDQEQLEKVAAKGCPECGSKLEKHGSVVVCPKCGTEPFEKQE